MKNILLKFLIFIFNLIVKPLTYRINIQFYNIYSKDILKLIINTTNSLSFWNIFNLILICLKNKMFKDIEDNIILKLNSDLDSISSNYKKALVGFKLDFISFMLTLSFIFKFISTFWYLILIFPLRTFINFIILLFVGLDFNYFIDIFNEVIYPYLISSFDYYKNIYNEFRTNLNNLINSSKGSVENTPINQIENNSNTVTQEVEIVEEVIPVWSDADINKMKSLRDDYVKTNDAINNLNDDNSINPAWYVLGACGILFLGIGIYIYFVVDRSVDDAVKDIIDSVKDLDFSKDKGIGRGFEGTTPAIDPSIANDVFQNTPSTSTAPGTVEGYSISPNTPKGGNVPLTETHVASTSAVAPEITNIIKTGQESLNKVGDSVKTLAANVAEKTHNVSDKVTNVVKDGIHKFLIKLSIIWLYYKFFK
jgi:hypothetical protein